jgi:hypothetical protein
LLGAPHFLETREQVIGPQAAFFGTLKIVDDLAAVHHDKAVSQTRRLMHGVRHHQGG